jgi:hypothetical protein
VSSLATNFDTLGILGKALAEKTSYGKPKSKEFFDPSNQEPREKLMWNRVKHGERVAQDYGKLPAVLGVPMAAGYETIKKVAMSDKKPFDTMAKDALMYIGRSPVGAAFYGQDPDQWANDPTSTSTFTIDERTRPASPETVAAYGRGVAESDAPLVNTNSLAEVLSGLFRKQE